MAAAHTPTPWHFEPAGFIDSKDDRVAALFPGFMAENGAFIALAANSHDQMASALRAGRVAIDVLMAQLIEVDPSFKPTQSAAWPALVAIKAALDAAEAA